MGDTTISSKYNNRSLAPNMLCMLLVIERVRYHMYLALGSSMDSIDKNHTQIKLQRSQAKPVHFISLAPRRLRHPSYCCLLGRAKESLPSLQRCNFVCMYLYHDVL